MLAEIAGEVYTIERHERLARSAEDRLAEQGYDRVHVRCGDGTLGWPEAAPFDAIVVAAGGPSVPESLREQLAIGGRLVIPVGEQVGLQTLRRVTRVAEHEYREEDLGGVRFVPLIGEEGWHAEVARPRSRAAPGSRACPSGSPRRRSSSARSRMRRSTHCSSASVTRASCCSARPPTAPPSSTGCVRASRGR